MSKTNCECKRIVGPCGLWHLEDLIGAKVRISSLPISNFGAIDMDQHYTVEDIEFRISLDGKAITIVKLKGLSDYIFTLKDLEFVGVIFNENIDKED